ncbi:MAG TPA: hypothetical protein DCR46_02070, partial [Cytophagales bacterium]|nr:hypothetical protein [Cytophagales bacterium]
MYNVALVDSGKYSLVVHAPNDTLSAFIQVKVFKSPEKITLYTQTQSTCAKEYQLFTKGDSLYSYQWYLNAKRMLGAADSTWKPSVTGVYSVTGFNAAGCGISSSPVYVDIDPDSIPFLTRLKNPTRLQAPLAQSYYWFVDNYLVAGSN